MTNNLAKIAKDLRAFAKRCKDVHYSDSLLISFILSGILSLASISFSDTFDNLSDSQKEAAMDSINEMRQQINYARKDNDKLIKGSSLELVKLMEQGDQVVKSPWGSQQFGFGYTYNSWGTSFKGRGGKQNDIKYRRTNDLTKYVYDPNLHEYGATNLHIKRNKEPDALVINPANVHKSYTPPIATRMDAMTMIDGPQFNPVIYVSNKVNTESPTYTYSTITNVIPTSITKLNNEVTLNDHKISNYDSTSSTVETGTFTTSNADYYNTYYSSATNSTHGPVERLPQTTTPPTHHSTITSITGYFQAGINGFHQDPSTTGTAFASYSDTWYYYVTVNGDPSTGIYNSGLQSGLHGRDMTDIRGTATRTFTGGKWSAWDYRNLSGASPSYVFRPNIILANNPSGLKVSDSTFLIDTVRNNASERNVIKVTSGGNLTIENTSAGTDNITYHDTYDTDGNFVSRQTGIHFTRPNETIFNLKSSNDNAINVAQNGGNVIIKDNLSSTTDKTKFNLEGSYNNGILVENNNTASTVTIEGSTAFNVSGSHNVGINMASGGKVDVTGTNFTINNSSIGILLNNHSNNSEVKSSNFTVTSGDGISLKNSSTLSLVSGGTFDVADGNGIFVENGSTLTRVSGTTFNVSGQNDNGILKEDAGVTTIEGGARFNVTGAGSTGVSYNGANTGTDVITGSNFTVSGGQNSSGIFMVRNKEIDINSDTTMNVSASSIGIAINNDGGNERIIKFNGGAGTGTNQSVAINLSGDKNIAVNIQNGNYTGGANRKIKLSDKLYVGVVGNENVVYNNQGPANEIKIENGVLTNNPTTSNGTIKVNGNKNVVFANLGTVEANTSDIDLDNVSINGDENVVAYFAPVNGNTSGWFNGTVKLQGIIGRELNTNSNRNIGVYAVSSQHHSLDGQSVGTANPVTMTDLKVSDINIGFGKNSVDGVLVYADKGTQVNVANATTANTLVNNTITDGVEVTGSNIQWGYHTQDINTSKHTTIAYSKGQMSSSTTGFGLYPSSADGNPTKIVIASPVDMVSREGVAYHTEEGGLITAKDTRAGGIKSILAYANGESVGTTNYTPSTIKVDGKITAADHNILGDINNTGGTPNTGMIHNNTSLEDTYKNVAGVAKAGGQVTFTNTGGASTDAKEKMATTRGTNVAVDKSLIYGMAAFASGKSAHNGIGSKIVFDKSTGGVTVVTGEDGGLFAEEDGQIEFNGNIVHQNNYSLSGVISAETSANGATVTGNRNGKLIGSHSADINDHTGKTPFYVRRINDSDTAAILFNNTTKVDMYDGILLTGNVYNGSHPITGTITNSMREFDYAKEDSSSAAGVDPVKWATARYRGMQNVTANILSDRVNLGIINQASDKITWDSNKSGGNGISGYLLGVGTYAGGMTIKNTKTHKVDSALINSNLVIDEDVNVEDIETTGTVAPVAPATTVSNDTFNYIKMESDNVVINHSKTVKGDAANRELKDVNGKANGNYQVKNVGLSMANSLWRWSDPDSKTSYWRKTSKDESGFRNEGIVDISGGNETTGVSVTGLLVNFGTIQNGDGTSAKNGVVRIDRGNALVATDGSVIKNLKDSEITVTGKYVKPTTGPTGGTNKLVSSETLPSGQNYGIVGVSNGYVDYNYADLINGTGLDNSIYIKHEDAKIYVEGDQATGIFAKNNDEANSSDVKIDFINTTVGNTGIDVSNPNMTSTNARGIGIALVNSKDNYKNGSINAGGTINLTGGAGTLGTFGSKATLGNPSGTTLVMNGNDILTGKNGIGVYGESTDINLKSDKFTVETGNNGVGIWVTDDSNIAKNTSGKTFQYNFSGDDEDSNAYAMAFTAKNKSNETTATNYLDIKFSNGANTSVTLADANKGLTSTGIQNTANKDIKGTRAGIAGILVNTNAHNDTNGDRVQNFGNIEEDKSSVTNVRAYGAVVNKGGLENWGNITLNDSLNELAKNVKAEDLKKVNIGILANDHTENARYNTYIENHGDIKVGTTSNQNVGGFGIYGYNVTTGPKADGSESTITINRNSYGVYSGDGTVNIQKGTKLLVGNDTVLGHEQTTKGTSSAAGAYPINRQTAYTAATDLLPGRTTDAAVGVYIGSNENLSKQNRNVDVSANMDIDRYSYGIVLAENNGGATTNVTIGSPTYSPTINLASNTKAGGQVKSHVPTNPAIPEEVYEQGNAVYYYSADKNSKGKTYANVTMNGDYNTAYRTAGSIDNYGTIDLRSQWDIANPTVDKTTGETINLGYGNLGIVSENPDIASTNYGKIITGMSDTQNMRYSAAMAAGRNVYDSNNTFVKTEADGYVINKGNIVVQAKDGIGMFATGSRSRAINYGNIELIGDNSTGMYLDRGAIGENYGTIEGSANNLRGVVAINGGYIKNYGTINVTGQNSDGIVTDSSRFIVDANGNPVKILSPEDTQYNSSQATTAGQNNGKDGSKDLYGGKENSIAEYTSGNPKTTGVGTTIAMPSVVPMTTITVDGVNTPIFTVDTDAATQGQWGEKISITSSIQTGGTRIIDLSQLDGWGNKMWNNYHTDQLSEVTSIGMYVDTSGVKYSNPINGIQNLKNLGEVNLYFGSEATLYTNAKAIRLGTNILKPFNDSLTNLPGGAVVNPLSASLTWQVAAKLDDKNQLTDVYMSKVPYHSFAFDDDTSLVNFTNNLDNVYEIVDFHTNEKEIFNKLNSLGNGEGHILAQAFDQMRAHIYGGIQQRTVATEKVFDSQVSGVMSSNGMVGNPSKDSTKYKAFGERGEYKTDTKGIPDYENYAGGFVAVHEGESIYKGEKHGWYTGVVDNNFSFKDIARSHENQAMIKGGLFKTTPFDVNGEFTWTIAGEGYFGRTDTNRRFWVVDKQYDAEAHYYTYGVALKNELAKSFRLSEGFAIKPHVGIDLEYGRYSSFHEDGTMSLDVKGNDYHSIKPNLGVDFTYKQPVFKKSMFVASLGLGYEKELGRVNDVTNEARIQGAWTDYFSIRGDKENKKGNYKADLNLGIDNGRLGFTVNAGYDSTGKNFRGGAGLRFIF